MGVLDIGSNSLRSLWGSIDDSSSFTREGGRLLTTRLGEGLSPVERGLKSDAIKRTLKGLLELSKVFKDNGVFEVYTFATSAVREASNRDHFLALVKAETGLDVDVLSGEEEAFQNLLGVEVGLGIKEGYILFDIGGGSTEIILKKGKNLLLKSFPLGALKLKNRFCSLTEALSFLEGYWGRELAAVLPILNGIETFIGVGGTASSLVLLKEGASFYDIRIAHGNRIEVGWLRDTIAYLSKLSPEDLERLFPFDPGRSYIILEGSLILLSLMEFFQISNILVSETNLLWGGLVKKWGVKRFIFGS